MATKSLLKNVHIKNKKQGKRFVNALEDAVRKPEKQIDFSKPYQEISGTKIKEILCVSSEK